jgi:hypothetical protein
VLLLGSSCGALTGLQIEAQLLLSFLLNHLLLLQVVLRLMVDGTLMYFWIVELDLVLPDIICLLLSGLYMLLLLYFLEQEKLLFFSKGHIGIAQTKLRQIVFLFISEQLFLVI